VAAGETVGGAEAGRGLCEGGGREWLAETTSGWSGGRLAPAPATPPAGLGSPAVGTGGPRGTLSHGPAMSLMFAKQFSEAGATGGSSGGKKGGRGNKGGGLMSKSKRRGKDLEDASDSATGLFTMDPNTPYRTHMLFPGRKEDDCGGPDPRRSSGSPSFVKAMMGWGGKRPSAQGAPGQEMARRGTPTRPCEGQDTEPLLDPLYRKSVSFQQSQSDGWSSHYPSYPSPTNAYPSPTNAYPSPTNAYPQPTNAYPPSTNAYPPPNNTSLYHSEPYREHDYASFAVGNMLSFLLTKQGRFRHRFLNGNSILVK
jgi:hypothetical protein